MRAVRTPRNGAFVVGPAPAGAAAPPAPGGFRADIEGLRGVAIALVVVSHVWFGAVTGGVDVFLMISGFFLIPSLLRRPIGARPTRTAMARIRRIVRRLWPPMAVVIAVTTAAALLVEPVTRFREIGVQAALSSVWALNWKLGT